METSDLLNLPADPTAIIAHKMFLIDLKHAHEQLQRSETFNNLMESKKRALIGEIVQAVKESANDNIYSRFNN